MWEDLEIKVSSMRKVRTEIVPVIIGALGTIKKGLDQTSVAHRSLVGHRVTVGQANEHCTQHF
jgi:hypothetical protein